METASQMLEDIESSSGASNGIRLSIWEQDFIDSIENWLGSGRDLTEKQNATLQKIWERA